MTMLVSTCVCSRLRNIFLTIVGVFRRALCCFSRQRRQSETDDNFYERLELTSVVADSGHQKSTEREKDWNSWDDGTKTIDEHIEMYRQQLAKANSPPEEQKPEIDFFEDMTPRIIRQQKILIGNNNSRGNNFERLAPQTDIPIATELEDWEDNENSAGWEELSDSKTKQLIRDKRKELRNQKLMQQKGATPNVASLGSRIGS